MLLICNLEFVINDLFISNFNDRKKLILIFFLTINSWFLSKKYGMDIVYEKIYLLNLSKENHTYLKAK